MVGTAVAHSLPAPRKDGSVAKAPAASSHAVALATCGSVVRMARSRAQRESTLKHAMVVVANF